MNGIYNNDNGYESGKSTNGDMIKSLFGKPAKMSEKGVLYKFMYKNGKPYFSTFYDREWWDMPYKPVKVKANSAVLPVANESSLDELDDMIAYIEDTAVYHDPDKLKVGEYHYTNSVMKERSQKLAGYLRELKEYKLKDLQKDEDERDI